MSEYDGCDCESPLEHVLRHRLPSGIGIHRMSPMGASGEGHGMFAMYRTYDGPTAADASPDEERSARRGGQIDRPNETVRVQPMGSLADEEAIWSQRLTSTFGDHEQEAQRAPGGEGSEARAKSEPITIYIEVGSEDRGLAQDIWGRHMHTIRIEDGTVFVRNFPCVYDMCGLIGAGYGRSPWAYTYASDPDKWEAMRDTASRRAEEDSQLPSS